MVTQTLPAWANKYLKDDAFSRVEQAVRAAELTTSGEIVPMIVKRSSVTGHLGMMSVMLMLLGAVVTMSGFLPLWAGILIFLCAMPPLFLPALYLRLWTPAHDLSAQVQRRAELEFYKAGLTETAGNTGILLFVSLDERRVIVLADKAIAAKLPENAWQVIVQTIITSIKAGDLTRGLCAAIAASAELLAPHFPRALDDRNELKDSLILRD